MTYDLSDDEEYSECPEPGVCTLDQQVQFYMNTYGESGSSITARRIFVSLFFVQTQQPHLLRRLSAMRLGRQHTLIRSRILHTVWRRD